jgi:porin
MGLSGFSTHVVVVNRSGGSDSALFGDHVNAVQEIYGGGGDVVAHFVYGYGEESLLDGKVDIAAGRIPVLNDFAASPLYCDFVNVSICGNPGSLSAGNIGFSTFPDATWGGRVRVRPLPRTYARVGAYEVSQGLFALPYFRSGWNFDTSRDSGVEVPVELGYEPTFGPDKLPGHYKIGFGYDSSSYADFYQDAAGNPALTSGQPVARHTGRFNAWVLVDQMLIRNGPGDDNGLIALGAFVHNDPRSSSDENQFTAGLLDRGFWPARPNDGIGALVTYQTISGDLGKQQALQQELGLPLVTAATGVQTHEVVFELNYAIHVVSGVTFMPDAQYVIRPNAERDIRNATVFGFKTHVTF